MTRDQYLHVRKTNSVDLGLFYNYYRQKVTSNIIPSDIFHQFFPMYIKANAKQVFEKLDQEFDVQVLMDKKGNEIHFI